MKALRSMPFFLMHAACAAVLIVPFDWSLVALAAALYAVRMFGITAGYHRYFAHRSYKMGRAAQFGMAFLGTMALQKGVLWWAANHRLHHRYADQPKDVHSPSRQGVLWAHVGWILSEEHEETRFDQVKDLAAFPELVWLNRWHLVPPALLGAALFLLGGWPAFVWGFVVSTVALWHGTFTVNSLAHLFGSRPYETTDTSRNNAVIALITLGEGWHNNHHFYMSSARQGFRWWQLDVSYAVLKALSWVGVTRDLKEPPARILRPGARPLVAVPQASNVIPSLPKTQSTSKRAPPGPAQPAARLS